MTDEHTATMPSTPDLLPEQTQRGNIWRLAIAQALAGANAVVIFATGAIVGNALAPSPMLATLPVSIFVVGMAACILPLGALARRRGRLAAFLAGAAAGVLAGLLAFVAVIIDSFWLFCVATFFAGSYAAVVQSFRFAAADGVAPHRRARALSLVMAGGVAAGVVGPQLVTWTMICGSRTCSPPPTWCRRQSRRSRPSSCSACACRCRQRTKWPAGAARSP